MQKAATDLSQGDPPIEVDGLRKEFGTIVAVDHLTFRIEKGSVTALLGGNGAGKTTTISLLLGLVTPSAGRAVVLGADMSRQRRKVLHRINFQSPYADMPHRLTVRQNLTVYAGLYGVIDIKARIAGLAETLRLGELLDRPAGKLSAGQKTRVGLAKALINGPEVLLLDEPTASLDPDTADWVRTHLENYREQSGATVLLASHNMSEVERLADRVIMLRAGHVEADDTPAGLIATYGRTTLEEVFLDIARGTGRAASPANIAHESHQSAGGNS
jgi:ABC-2 type transport system ATP-binding protein